MTVRITPSILNANLANLAGEVGRIPSADGIHIDVMDCLLYTSDAADDVAGV